MKSDVLTCDRQHVFRAWSAQRRTNPGIIAGGSGAWFWDETGRRFLDYCSQRVNLNLGHQHPRIVSAIVKQAQQIATMSQIHASEPRSEAARLIAERTPGDLNKIFFTNSGSDAVENAIRLARLHTGRLKIFAAYRSFHGATAAGLTLTGDPRRWRVEPGLPGVVHFMGPYRYRSSFGAETEAEECDKALKHLEEMLAFEGPQNVAAIILEPVVGTNGILVPPDGYLAGVRRICDNYGIVMICDEVMCGFGRCGEWFAVNRWDVIPDLITFAKGVNSGYVPLGGVAISTKIAQSFDDVTYPGGGTYFGHPLACATAVESIRVFEEESILERARHLGANVIGPGLRLLAEKHPSIGDVRGIGCFWAIELVTNRQTKKMLVPFNAKGPSAAPMVEIEKACHERGLWALFHDNRIHMCPPLIISDNDARLGISILDEVLSIADRYVD